MMCGGVSAGPTVFDDLATVSNAGPIGLTGLQVAVVIGGVPFAPTATASINGNTSLLAGQQTHLSISISPAQVRRQRLTCVPLLAAILAHP